MLNKLMNNWQLFALGIGGLLLVLSFIDWYSSAFKYSSWQRVTGTVTSAKAVRDPDTMIRGITFEQWHPEIKYTYSFNDKKSEGVYTEKPNNERSRIEKATETAEVGSFIELLIDPATPSNSVPSRFVDMYGWARMLMAIGGVLFIAGAFLINFK